MTRRSEKPSPSPQDRRRGGNSSSSPSTQEIGPRGFEFSRARAHQKEADPPLFDHKLGLVEKGRALLDLVDHYQAVAQALRLHLAPDQGRIGEEPQKHAAIERGCSRAAGIAASSSRMKDDFPVCLGPKRKSERSPTRTEISNTLCR